MAEVQSISGLQACQISGLSVSLPVACKVGMIDGRMIAIGGIAWGGGRCWLFFHVDNPPRNILRQALAECRSLLRKAAQFGETEVYTPRDAEYETSERLCRLAGFVKTDEVIDGKEIWRANVQPDKELT